MPLFRKEPVETGNGRKFVEDEQKESFKKKRVVSNVPQKERQQMEGANWGRLLMFEVRSPREHLQ